MHISLRPVLAAVFGLAAIAIAGAAPAASPVKAMNATYLAKFLRDQSVSIRDAAQVRRIIAALDEKCRTVEF